MTLHKHKKGAPRTSPALSPSPSSSFPSDLKDWQCVALLAVLVLVFFRDILLGNAFLWEVFLYHDYPSRNFAAVSMSMGEIPLWNPFTFNGMPFLADIQKAVFYLPCTALALFVKNGPSVAGLGLGGEGYLSYSIATTTGEGITTPETFTRTRRCVMVDNLRIY